MNITHALQAYRGLPKSIYIMFLARIVNSLGAFVYPFLTLFMTDKLGVSAEFAGNYFFAAAIASAIGALLGGFIADHLGRKKTLLLFQGLAALAFIPCAFLGDSLMIPKLLITASFFGGAAQPANSAMVADLTDETNRKQSFSLLYLGINIGFAIGPLVAGFLYYNYTEWIFIGDALTTLVALSLVAIYVKESKPTEEKLQEGKKLETGEKTENGFILFVLLRRPALLAFACVSAIYSFVFVQHGFSIPIQMAEQFGEEVGPKLFGGLMTTNALVVVLMTLFVTSLTKKLKPILNISISGLLCAIGFGMLYKVEIYPLYILSTMIWTLGEILNVTNTGVYIANHAPMSHRARFNAILPIITGTGYAIGPQIMGKFIDSNGVRMVWPVTFFLALGGATLMFGLYLIETGIQKKKAQGV